MTNLIRYRYNTMAAETPNGEWTWRVILEQSGAFQEILTRQLVVGRKFHMACHGTFRLDDDGTGYIEP
jgi:hypothetical protein